MRAVQMTATQHGVALIVFDLSAVRT